MAIDQYKLEQHPSRGYKNLRIILTSLSGRNGFLQLLGGSSIGRGINFGINLLLSRVLGPSQLGLFTLILNASQTFELLSRAGVDTGLNYALTEQKGSDDLNKEKSLINTALKIVRLTSCFLLALLLLWLGPGNGLLPIELDNNRSLIIIITSLICVAESLSGLPWDILLIKGEVNIVRLRQGLFAPLKLLAALMGASLGGVEESLTCYAAMAGIQAIWLDKRTKNICKIRTGSSGHLNEAKKLVGDGLGLYANNVLSAMVFLPLLANIANSSGLQSVGYLRAGQIVVQLFTLVPGALAPVLFIKYRTSETNEKKNIIAEQSLLLIWCFGLATLLGYILIDKQLINFLFGSQYLYSLQPTRMLIYITILESIGQILHTSILANRQIKLFLYVQNIALALSAILGWYFIPKIGLDGFILAKFVFAGVPTVTYLWKAWSNIENRSIIWMLSVAGGAALPLCWIVSLPFSLELALTSLMVILVVLAGISFKRSLVIHDL